MSHGRDIGRSITRALPGSFADDVGSEWCPRAVRVCGQAVTASPTFFGALGWAGLCGAFSFSAII